MAAQHKLPGCMPPCSGEEQSQAEGQRLKEACRQTGQGAPWGEDRRRGGRGTDSRQKDLGNLVAGGERAAGLPERQREASLKLLGVRPPQGGAGTSLPCHMGASLSGEAPGSRWG